jgi:hypothetical protein
MPPSSIRTRRLWLFLPFALLVLLAVAWSVFWVMAARRADATITAWLEQEARLGRIYRCASRESGGYPFRIEVRCTAPTLELANAQPVRVLKAQELRGVAQVYTPNLIIAEISGPLAITEAGQPAVWRADWRLAQASLRGLSGTPERLSVVLDGVQVERADGGGASPAAPAPAGAWAAANHLEFHLRRDPAAASGQPVIDFAGQVNGATLPSVPALTGKPFDGEVTALLSGLTEWKPMPLPARLKQWQAAGGRLQVTRLRIQQGDAVVAATGSVGLSTGGRPDGMFDVTMAGIDRLVQQFGGNDGAAGGLQIGLLAGLAFLGRPAEIDGKRAIAVALRLNDGAVSLGPIRLGKMEPLY